MSAPFPAKLVPVVGNLLSVVPQDERLRGYGWRVAELAVMPSTRAQNQMLFPFQHPSSLTDPAERQPHPAHFRHSLFGKFSLFLAVLPLTGVFGPTGVDAAQPVSAPLPSAIAEGTPRDSLLAQQKRSLLPELLAKPESFQPESALMELGVRKQDAQEPGVRSQESGVNIIGSTNGVGVNNVERSQELGARSQESGVRSQESGDIGGKGDRGNPVAPSLISVSSPASSATPIPSTPPAALFREPEKLPRSVLLAQVVPAADGTGTVVTPDGNRFDISGGQLSSDGANLFHSLSRLGLTQEQIANFLASPETRNILTRITGGSPSIIDGKIQVTGGNANLYLINPAGMVFGNNARLDVAGSFTATTANAIGFGNQQFNTLGANDYAGLTGTPNSLAFQTLQPGAIVNSGNLSVLSGRSLNLIGGTVINTGTLSAPGGQIMIAAVPGTSRVRISETGSLLSVEVEQSDLTQSLKSTSASGENAVLQSSNPPSLPELLSGGEAKNATNVGVNQQGQVVLSGAGVKVDPTTGSVVVSGTLDVSGAQGGTVQVLGDRIALTSASINASGSNGGTVMIGGDYQGKGMLPTASRTTISADSTIRADGISPAPVDKGGAANGGISSGGRVIVWSNGNTQFYGSITAKGSATGGDGGFVEVSGKNNLVFQGKVDTSAPKGQVGTLLLDPTNITVIAGPGSFTALTDVDQFADPDIGANTIDVALLNGATANVVLQASNDITFNTAVNIATSGVGLTAQAGNNILVNSPITTNNGAVTLTATNSITASGNITTTGGAIALSATNGNITTANLNSFVTGFATAQGGQVTLTANAGSILTGAINTAAAAAPTSGNATATAGVVTLQTLSPGGNIQFTSINTTSNATASSGNATAIGGNVSVLANGLVRGTGGGTTIDVRATAIASGTQTITNGAVALQHDGGVDNLRFEIGNAAALNGTAGAIATGTTPFTSAVVPDPVTVPLIPTNRTDTLTALGSTPLNVTFLNQTPSLTVGSSSLSAAQPSTPISFTFATLAPLVSDANLDNTFLVIESVNIGSLTRNGVSVVANTPLQPGDSLVYTPPTGVSGLLSNAFTLRANDRISFSNQVPININIQSPPVTPTPPGTPNTPQPCQGKDCLPLPELPRTILPIAATSECSSTDVGIYGRDDAFAREFEDYLGKGSGKRKSLVQTCRDLASISAATGMKPAIVYAAFSPGTLGAGSTVKPTADGAGVVIEGGKSKAVDSPLEPADAARKDSDQLELIVVTEKNRPIYKRLSVTRAELVQVVRQLRTALTDPVTLGTDAYLPAAQQLYQWLVAPYEASLKQQEITNLVFVMDSGLRAVPMAALNDGKQFLVEKYSLGLMPSLSITDTRYRNIRQDQVLAMGASTFEDDKPLPAVTRELQVIQAEGWRGRSLLNQQFTLANLLSERRATPFGILHLATHTALKPDTLETSYIQLWNTKLQFNQLGKLGLADPPVNLLVLSSCRTALGDDNAELGFAGLAYQSGAKSVLASLWAVDDIGTLALMSDFYRQLKQAPIRAEALRQAQIAMLQKQVRLEGGKLVVAGISVELPPELQGSTELDLSNPYYWASFTMVGNPW